MRHSRPLAPAVALVSILLMGGIAAAATKLTPANSFPFEFAASSSETLAGTGCGTTATSTKTLPAGATGIKVVEPKVGDRDGGQGTRVTAVTVAGTVVTITVLSDGASICDPNQTGVPAGEPVNWTADYDVRAEYKRRVQATIRVHYESYIVRGATKWKLRPRTIRDTRPGAPPGTRLAAIKWKRFGGRIAVGSATVREDWCPRGGNCPPDGKRARVVASKPDYCTDSGKIEYLDVQVYVGKTNWYGWHIDCS